MYTELNLEATMKTPTMKSVIWACACLTALPAMAASCDNLASLALPDTTITSAQVVAAGQFSAPGAEQAKGEGANAYADLPEFCRVAATIKPTSDSDIKVEVWLPTRGWNGNFQGVGNGGWAGVISYRELGDALRGGYATASTDTGHVGGRGTFALGSSREADRFRVALRTRDDREGQGRHPGFLRQRAQAFVLERLLHGRAGRASRKRRNSRTITTASSPERRPTGRPSRYGSPPRC